MDAFAAAVTDKGALPYDGYVTDTKIALQAIMPGGLRANSRRDGRLWAEPRELRFRKRSFVRSHLSPPYLVLESRDHERGAEAGSSREAGSTTPSSIRKGPTNSDAETTVSALKDVISTQLNAEGLRRRMEAIRQANSQAVDPSGAKESLKKQLLKSETDAVIEAYNSPDTYNLPTGNTMWRLSNAVSWIAGKTEDAERRLELMKVAGDMHPPRRRRDVVEGCVTE